jgi:glycosyltransferase involved in cell wall biosynthesis
VEEAKIHVVPHGVLHYYSALEGDSGDEAHTPNLLFFGNLHPYKGVDILLRAFARLSPKNAQNTTLTIAGRAEMDVEPLRRLARQLQIEDRLDWRLRPIPESEVPTMFRSATAVVLPYREIDQSGVLMTAIAFGKPILATRVGGIPETIQNGVHGYLVQPEDADSLAVAADRLLEDAESRKRMAMAVRDLCSGKLSWASIASRTVGLYRDLLDIRWNVESITQPIPLPGN